MKAEPTRLIPRKFAANLEILKGKTKRNIKCNTNRKDLIKNRSSTQHESQDKRKPI